MPAFQTAAVRQLCIATGVPAAAVFTAGVQPDNIIPARSGGNVDLQEESSDTLTFGVVFTPSSCRVCGDRRLLRHHARRRDRAARRRRAEHAEPLLPRAAGRSAAILPGRPSQPGHGLHHGPVLARCPAGEHRRARDLGHRPAGALWIGRGLRHGRRQPLRYQHRVDLHRRVRRHAHAGCARGEA